MRRINNKMMSGTGVALLPIQVFSVLGEPANESTEAASFPLQSLADRRFASSHNKPGSAARPFDINKQSKTLLREITPKAEPNALMTDKRSVDSGRAQKNAGCWHIERKRING